MFTHKLCQLVLELGCLLKVESSCTDDDDVHVLAVAHQELVVLSYGSTRRAASKVSLVCKR